MTGMTGIEAFNTKYEGLYRWEGDRIFYKGTGYSVSIRDAFAAMAIHNLDVEEFLKATFEGIEKTDMYNFP